MTKAKKKTIVIAHFQRFHKQEDPFLGILIV